MNITVYPLLILQIILFVLLAPVVLPVARIVTGRSLSNIVRYFVWVYGRVWMMIISPFVIFERHGLSRDKFPTPCIIVLNHISFFDTFCMGALPLSNIVFTVRAWPFRMPWYAPFMRMAGYVNMEAQHGAQALARCREHLMSRASLVFFPEAHRSRDGKLGRFYSGAFKLAVQTGTPIVPI
ncbi:MAG: lysophospholipid acyltransferase family protein, partial [Desulfonatronovibrio sp.]